MTSNGLSATEKWLSRVAPTTARVYKFYIAEWLKWLEVNGGAYAGLSPDELITYQKTVSKQDEWALLDLTQAWVLSLGNMRSSTKRNALKAVRSFFSHNRIALPTDTNFHVRGDLPVVANNLTVQEIRQVCLASNKAMRTSFLIMLMGGMDQSSFEWWSDNCWEDLNKQLRENPEFIKIVVPGRKGSLNEVEFSTYIYGDGLDSLRDYLKYRGSAPGAIIQNQFHRPITKVALADYWTRQLLSLGIVSRTGIKTERYGRGVHNLRDTFRTQWAISGAAPAIAESFMGHKIDELGYNQSPDNMQHVKEQIHIAKPYLNILTASESYGMVKVDTVDALKAQLEALQKEKNGEVALLRQELATQRQAIKKEILDLLRPDEPVLPRKPKKKKADAE